MTSYNVIFEQFFRLVEKDKDFFRYYHLSEEQSRELARIRAETYLNESCVQIMLSDEVDTDFLNRDSEKQQFNFDLSDTEILLVASFMYERYLSRDISKLLSLNANYTPSDLQVFSPAADRTSFMTMYKDVCENNKAMLANYASMDSSFKQKKLNYTL